MDRNIDEISKENCKVHVMQPQITDEDISSLLNGIIGVIKHKTQLDNQSEIIKLTIKINKLEKELKLKTAECNQLKTEISYLKTARISNNQK